jgi:uncharacterized delta-60 repeat protein
MLLILGTPAVHSLEGDPDPSFGHQGQVAIAHPEPDAGNGTHPTGDLTRLADGRYLWAAVLPDTRTWIGRAFRNGSPDAGVGTSEGRVTLPACGSARNVRLVPHEDAAATVWACGRLLRIDSSGAVDPEFGAGQIPHDTFEAADLVRDASGRYVVAGIAGVMWTVLRFDAQGHLDSGFGTGGVAEIDVPAMFGFRQLNALAVRPDGRVLIGGARGNRNGPSLVLVQLDESGVLDTAWNGDGMVDMEATPPFEGLIATAMSLDEDGSLVVAGAGSDGSQLCCDLLARFDAAGQIVPTFGLRVFRLPESPSLSLFGEQRDSVEVLDDGRILMGSVAFPLDAFNHRTQYTLIRTLADGSLDSSFGTGGWRGYAIADPAASGQGGDYNQMHATAWDPRHNDVPILGRTFFEDQGDDHDYVTFVRVLLDRLFVSGFER